MESDQPIISRNAARKMASSSIRLHSAAAGVAFNAPCCGAWESSSLDGWKATVSQAKTMCHLSMTESDRVHT